MCGIAGIVAADELDREDARLALRMRDVLVHRGPDEAGLFVDGAAALGHRRLSIIDLASGQQPLANEDETVWVSYNGEIYNHAELRVELEAAGHTYRTHSDTETIVHAYEQWGDDCVHRFRGMFAFAIWDAQRRRLLLARDRLGIKPLYWALAGDRLLFASEIKAILESGLIDARANEPAFPELLSTRSLAGTETLFERIWKLLPGHLLEFARGRVATRRFWNVPVGRADDRPSRPWMDDVREFRRLLEESVRLRLMSDVPLGMFLSGGLDSSALAALMARMIDRPLETFSVAFEDRAANELDYAREVSHAIGARAHEIIIDDRDFFEALPRLVWHEDEPIAHPSSVPLYYVSKLARDHVKVVLTGEGSDELLAGYGRYPRALVNWRLGRLYAAAVPRGFRSRVARLTAHLPASLRRYARRSFLAVEHAPDLSLFDPFAAIDVTRQRELCAPRIASLITRERAYGSLMVSFDEPPASTALLDRLLYTDMRTYLVELLMKQDQMSMASSIESRVPFLDHRLVEFAATLPPDRKLAGFSTKRILREAVRDLLPATVLKRPKMGFPVPFARWMRSGWNDVVRDVLLDSRSRHRGIISPPAVERLLADARAGAHGTADAVWALLNLELWHRTFIDGDGPQVLPLPRPTPFRAAGADARRAVSGASAPRG